MKELDEMTLQGERPLAISQLQAQLPNLEDNTLDLLATDIRNDPKRFIDSVGQGAALAFIKALKHEFDKRRHTFSLDDVIEEGASVGCVSRQRRRAIMAADKRKKRRERRRAAKR